MLIKKDLSNNIRTVTTLKNQQDFDNFMKKISAFDYQRIVKEINKYIDNNKKFAAAWIPGTDWTGTVYEPIAIACANNKTEAGYFFGLIVFDLLMNRRDKTWEYEYKLDSTTKKKRMLYCEV